MIRRDKMDEQPEDFRPHEDVSKEREIHLFDYLHVIVRRKWVVIICFCTVMIAVAVFTFLQTPLYRAESKVRIWGYDEQVMDFKGVMSLDVFAARGGFYNSELQVITSREVAQQVVERLHLDLHPEFTGASTHPSIWNLFGLLKKKPEEGQKEKANKNPVGAVADALRGRIDVGLVRLTSVVSIVVTAKDPNLATRIANTYAEEYARYNLEVRSLADMRASEELGTQLTALKKDLEKSEKNLYEYAKEQEMVALGETELLLGKKIEGLNLQLNAVTIERIKAESLYVQSASLNPGYLPAILDSKVVVGLETKYANLHAEYMHELERVQPGHPKARQLKAKLDAIAKALENEKQKITSSIKEEYVEVVEREKAFKRQMDDLLGQKESLEAKLVQYRILTRDVGTNTALYHALLKRMKETTISSEIKTPNVSIVDRATVPGGPFKPKKGLNLMLGVIAGLFLGLGLAFFIEYLDTSVKAQEDVEKKIGVTFLGVVPNLTHSKGGEYY